MREILFRGKRKSTGEWEEGSLLVSLGGDCSICCSGPARNELSQYAVYPSTVGQYTGLDDKYGKMIFEGDIVRYQADAEDCPFPEKSIGSIFFSDLRANFSVVTEKRGSLSAIDDLFKYIRNENRVEVIGNIYDDPELLKGEAK